MINLNDIFEFVEKKFDILKLSLKYI